MTTIVLAAGLSSRMGENKLLMLYEDKPILEHVLSKACKASDKTIVVAGFEKEKLKPILEHYAVELAINEDYEKGQLSSIKKGLEKVINDDFSFITGDLPLIEEADLVKVFEALKANSSARASYNGEPGHPVAYKKEYREKLLAFPGTMKEFNKAISQALVPCSIGSVFDVDTKERYCALVRGDYNL